MKYLALYLLVFFKSLSGYCQTEKLSPLPEHIAFGYFIDSIIPSHYPSAKVYSYPSVNNRQSAMRFSHDWADYRLKGDSTELIWASNQNEVLNRLTLPERTLTTVWKGNTIKKGIAFSQLPKDALIIEVHKRTVGRYKRFAIEIVAYQKEGRTHYYFEFSPIDNVVKRWYKVNFTY